MVAAERTVGMLVQEANAAELVGTAAARAAETVAATVAATVAQLAVALPELRLTFQLKALASK